MQRRAFLTSAMAIGALGYHRPLGARSLRLTVRSENRPSQTYAGFGVSQSNNDIIYSSLPREAKDRMLDLVFRGLPIDVLRLWAGPHQWTALSLVDAFSASYLDNAMLPDIFDRRRPELLLAPGIRKIKALPTPRPYAEALAEAIAILRHDKGVPISVTGLANEPQEWGSDRIVATTLALREALDRRGLERVGIIAPELANVDPKQAIPAIQALRATPKAWSAMRGVGVHSYNMALTPAAQAAARGKELWVTESGWGFDLRDRPSDRQLEGNDAAVVAARFLADLNHGATHWIYFLGFRGEMQNAFVNSRTPELVVSNPSGRIVVQPRYHYLQALVRHFAKGTVIHPCYSSVDKSMSWTYGPKPSVIAASGVGSDGRRRAALVNVTGSPSRMGTSFAPRSYAEVSLIMPSAGSRYRVESVRAFEPTRMQDVASDSGGQISLELAPFELLLVTES